MYGQAYGWTRQSWRTAPADMANVNLPYNQQPRQFQKRDVPFTGNETIANNATEQADGGPPVVCHADANSDNNNGKEKPADADLDYDNLLFLDMAGNRIDGRACDVIYEDDPQAQRTGSNVRIFIDEDGNMVDMYMGDDGGPGGEGLWRGGEEATVTTAEADDAVTITATIGGEGAARPGSGEVTTGLPERTGVTTARRGSVVTMPPL